MDLGPSLPPASQARRDSTLFVEVKRLFSTMPVAEIFSKSSWIEIEANGSHWGDRTRYRHDRTCPVSDSSSLARGLGFTIGASGHSRDRHVRSGARGTTNAKGRSDAVARPVTIDRTRPVVSGSLRESTGRWHCGVRLVQAACPVAWSATRISGDRMPKRVRSL
jgi:hypothetical protein